MAEERIKMPLSLEIVELKDGSLSRGVLTPEITEPKDGSLRRSSLGISSTSSGREKITPNYLRASTGSCHDVCKYGGHHTRIKKEKRPILKGRGRSSEGHHPITIVTPQTRKKSPAVKATSTRDPVTESCDTPVINKQETTVIKKKALSPVQKIANGKTAIPLKPKHVTEKPPSSILGPPRNQSGRIDTDVKTGKKSDVPKIVQKKDLVLQNSLSPPKLSIKRTTSIKTRKLRVLSSASPLKNENKPKVVGSKPPVDGKSQVLKGASPLKNFTNAKKIESKPPVDKKYQVMKGGSPLKNTIKAKKMASKQPVDEKYRVLNGASPLKNVNKAKKEESRLSMDENVIEKSIYFIEPKPEKILERDTPSSASTCSSPPPSVPLNKEEEYIESEYDETEASSEYDETETDSEYDDTKKQYQFESSKDEYKRKPRRGSAVHPGDNDPGHKLKFRRGKVVDLQSENNGPRRLKFRKRRGWGDDENSKDDLRKINIKKTEVSDGATTDEPESEIIILRHQDVNGKKDAQRLFNNVIEETASKLVETRKSKVKALVGAFETVISLQEK